MANKQGKMVCIVHIAVFEIIHANCRAAKSGTAEQPKCKSYTKLTANPDQLSHARYDERCSTDDRPDACIR
jgi:hypothetical protein